MRQKAVSTEEFNTNTTQEIEIPMTEEIYRGDEMFNDKFEVVQEAEFKDFHETEKFMKDILTVELPISDSKQSQFVQVYVQGVPQLFQRGAKQKVKRMFVEALARARPYTIQTPEYIEYFQWKKEKEKLDKEQEEKDRKILELEQKLQALENKG